VPAPVSAAVPTGSAPGPAGAAAAPSGKSKGAWAELVCCIELSY
jgi:hypothetical protein